MGSKQAGNAIIIILIAVFLFGALAAAFMRGTRTGQTNLTAKQVNLKVTELISYSNALEKAVNKVRQRGCSERQISFEGSFDGGTNSYDNANSPSDMSCHIFQSAGGDLSDLQFTSIMTEETSRDFGYNLFLATNSIEGVGTAAPELLFVVPDLTLQACNTINATLNVTGDMAEDDTNNPGFAGTFPPSANTIIGDDNTNPATIEGKSSFCMQRTSSYYQFIHVLIER